MDDRMRSWYPPTYYNHFIEHPILWTNERRRWEDQKLSRECFEVWQSQQRIAQLQKLKNQSEYREMVNNWNPFGKSGCGAPNQDIRIRNLEVDGLYPVSKNTPRTTFTLPRGSNLDRRSKVYTPGMSNAVSGGSGAPILTESGRFLVPLREDPAITFHDSTRSFVEKDLRYRKTPNEQTAYRQELDRIVEEKKSLKFNDKFALPSGFKNSNNGYDQFDNNWGRPGPGGTPWRDPKNIGQNFMKSMGWTTKDTLRSIHNEINDKRDIQLPACGNNVSPCCEKCSCECIKKVESTILRSPTKKENKIDYDGQPCSKAPKKAPHYALPQQCNRQERLEPIQTAPQMSSKQKFKSPVKKESKTSLISGGVELVPLLAKRREERPISLSTTDITKYKINKSSWQNGDPELLDDLERQVMQRNRLRQLSREREVESSRQHFAKFDSFWGRPGCGAPQSNRNKLKLDDLLYNAPMYEHYPQQY